VQPDSVEFELDRAGAVVAVGEIAGYGPKIIRRSSTRTLPELTGGR
jgi:hypothetical protein